MIGFLVAPTDAQQGEGYRIIFLHVPASWMSMFIYLVMAFWAGLGLAFNFRLSGMMASALAPTGASSPSSRCGPAHCGASRCGAPGGCGMRA
jgi:heme exporter protein C